VAEKGKGEVFGEGGGGGKEGVNFRQNRLVMERGKRVAQFAQKDFPGKRKAMSRGRATLPQGQMSKGRRGTKKKRGGGGMLLLAGGEGGERTSACSGDPDRRTVTQAAMGKSDKILRGRRIPPGQE